MGSWGRAVLLISVLSAKLGMAYGDSRGACFSDPEQLFKKNPALSTVYICSQDTQDLMCREALGNDCERVSLQHGLKKLNLIKNNSPRKQLLASYLAAVQFDEQVIQDSKLSIQTGKYQQVTASQLALSSKCMTTIVLAAYKLHQHFPNYSFVIDSHIQNCNNLKDGVKQLIANRQRVRENLDRFHSPLHSVFLTNRTRFVHRELGMMGLHVNVNRRDEIRKRLIDYEVSSIPTDGIKRLSGIN